MRIQRLIVGALICGSFALPASALAAQDPPLRPFIEFATPPNADISAEGRNSVIATEGNVQGGGISIVNGDDGPNGGGTPPPDAWANFSLKNVDIPYSSSLGSTNINWKWYQSYHNYNFGCLYLVIDGNFGNGNGSLITCEHDGNWYNTNIPWLQYGHSYFFYIQLQNGPNQQDRNTAYSYVAFPGPARSWTDGWVTTSRPITISISPNPATIPAGADSSQVTIDWSHSPTFTASQVTWYGSNSAPPYNGGTFCLGSPASSGTTTARIVSGQYGTLYVVPYDGCVPGTQVNSVPLPVLNQVDFSVTN